MINSRKICGRCAHWTNYPLNPNNMGYCDECKMDMWLFRVCHDFEEE